MNCLLVRQLRGGSYILSLRFTKLSPWLAINFCLVNYCFNCQAIMAEGKQHALAIGFTKMSAKNM